MSYNLWTSGQLGQHSPHALLQTVWFYNTMHFGWRGCDEHRCACYGDFLFGRHKGQEYVEFCTERGTKTRTGAEAGESLRGFNPRMYATGTERCPVSIFKNYIQKRPQQACKPDSPLYLSVVYCDDQVPTYTFVHVHLHLHFHSCTYLSLSCHQYHHIGRHSSLVKQIFGVESNPMAGILLAPEKNCRISILSDCISHLH